MEPIPMELIPIGAKVVFTYLTGTPLLGKVIASKYNVVKDHVNKSIYPIAYLIENNGDSRWIDANNVIEVE